MRGGEGQGSNSAQVRRFNERVILTLLRRLGAASKADLSRHARLTQNATGQIVRELEEQALVRVDGKRLGGRGQPATILRLNPQGAFAIGVKLGRRSLDALLVDFGGRVLDRRHRDQAFPLPDEATAFVVESVAKLTRRLGDAGAARLTGLGVAIPYNLGSWRRELDLPEGAYRRWNEFDAAGALAAATGLATFCENDGTAAAVAELFHGHGRTRADFLYLFVGAAIGGGVIVAGDYRRGVSGNAGDVGLMPVPPSGLSTAPRPGGPFDLLLTRASLNGLIRHLRGNGIAVEGQNDLERLLDPPHRLVEEWLDDAADALVCPVLSAVRVLDVEVVVIDGNLPRSVLDGLLQRTAVRLVAASPERRPPPHLVRGSIGREAPAIGAAILPLHLNFSPSRNLPLGQSGRPAA